MAAAVAAGAAVVGTALTFFAQRKAGKAEREAADQRQRGADKEAAHMEQQATLSVAAAQRQMLEERKQARLLESRALAVAAASGAGTGGTVIDVISDIAAEGAYRSSLALFEGKERARQLRVGAEIRREGGDLQAEYGRQAAKAYEIGSVATLFSGAGSLYARYGMTKSPSTLASGASVGDP